jgi:CRISPR-associated protein Csm1
MGGERPWRYHRRIRRILNASRTGSPERPEFQKARTALIADLIGRSAITVKLRPAGRVALEWARLSAAEA